MKRPVYLSLASVILRAIRAGELTGGDRLPTHRDLAFELGISVQTVSRAYDELIRVGTISGQVSLFPKLVFTYKTAVQVFH